MLTGLWKTFPGLVVFAHVFLTPAITAADHSLTHRCRQVGTILVVALVLACLELEHLLQLLPDFRVPV